MDKWLYRISGVLALIGLAVSIYMTIYKVTANDAMCLGSGDCSTVNASRYSEVYGIPVATIGIAGYFAGHQGFAAELVGLGVKRFFGLAVFHDFQGPEMTDPSDVSNANVFVCQFIEFLFEMFTGFLGQSGIE